MEHKDKRLKWTSEILSGIKVSLIQAHSINRSLINSYNIGISSRIHTYNYIYIYIYIYILI